MWLKLHDLMTEISRLWSVSSSERKSSPANMSADLLGLEQSPTFSQREIFLEVCQADHGRYRIYRDTDLHCKYRAGCWDSLKSTVYLHPPAGT